MRAWVSHLRERWANWCGDREMEMAIRKSLTINGYYGRSAKLRNVRIVAIQRPGWVQIYRFDATARLAQHEVDGVDNDDALPTSLGSTDHELYGLVLDDGRKRSEIRVFRDANERRSLFDDWSEGLICLRGKTF